MQSAFNVIQGESWSLCKKKGKHLSFLKLFLRMEYIPGVWCVLPDSHCTYYRNLNIIVIKFFNIQGVLEIW